MFHNAALTSKHEIKMFVEVPKWEMTRGQWRKQEGGHIQRQEAALGNTLSTDCRGCTTAQTSSDGRAETAALPNQEKLGLFLHQTRIGSTTTPCVLAGQGSRHSSQVGKGWKV